MISKTVKIYILIEKGLNKGINGNSKLKHPYEKID